MPAVTAANGESFERLGLKPGAAVVVTQGDLSISGQVEQIDATRLVVGSYVFAANAKLTIEKAGDPIWDRAGYGFLFGAIAPHLVEEGCWMRSAWHCSLQTGLTFAVIGALIDLAHRGHTTVHAGGRRN